MNKPNNKRSRDTDEAIIRAAFEVMVGEGKPVSKITVREICELAGINRSTFYAHYLDVYDLFEKVERHMAEEFAESFLGHFHSGGIQAALESVFAFVGSYADFYKIYFKEVSHAANIISCMMGPFQEQIEKLISQDPGHGVEDEMLYHLTFFTAGVAAMLNHWLHTGCKETPSQLFDVLLREYGPHSLLRTWLLAG